MRRKNPRNTTSSDRYVVVHYGIPILIPVALARDLNLQPESFVTHDTVTRIRALRGTPNPSNWGRAVYFHEPSHT